jgi:fatty acid desaturase
MNEQRTIELYTPEIAAIEKADKIARQDTMRRIRRTRIWEAVQVMVASLALGFAVWDGVKQWGGFLGGFLFMVALTAGALIGSAALVSHDRADRLADRYEESAE